MSRRIQVAIVGDSASVERAFARSRTSAEGFGGAVGKLSIGIGQLAKSILIVDAVQKALQGLGAAAHLGIEGFEANTKAAAQTAAVLKSTGDAANIGAKGVAQLATQLSELSGQTKASIQGGENVLLSFTRIRNFAGANNDIFTQATKAIVDYSARTGKDASQAALIFGKALEDPASRVSGLARAGIVLTKSQTEAVKALQKTGGVLAAQKLLLSDITARYQGAAKAAGETLPGQLDRLRDHFQQFGSGIVSSVVGPLRTVAGQVNDTLDKLSTTSGFTAKLNVLWTGIEEAGHGAETALKQAVSKVDWKKVWAGANGIADGLAARLKAVDWKSVGSSIGDGIAKAISVAASATKSIAAKLETIFKAIDWEKLGAAAGPGLATALVTAFTTLTDPTFWIKHWDLALAVASVAFSDGLGRIAGKLAEPFVKLGVTLSEGLTLSIASGVEKIGPRIAESLSGALGKAADAVERVAPRLGKPVIRLFDNLGVAAVKAGEEIAGGVLKGLLKLPGVVENALSKLTAPITRAFSRLGGLTRLTIKILGAQAAIDIVANAVSKITSLFGKLAGVIGSALDGAWRWLEHGAIKAALAIVDPFTHIPTALVGHKFQDIKAALDAQLNGMVTNTQTAAANMQAAFNTVTGPGLTGPLTKQSAAKAARLTPAGVQGPLTSLPQLPPLPPAPPANGGLTATQKNTFFDNAISSDLERAGFITNIKSQIGALQTIAGLISARIAATKDVTRRRTLENQLLSVESQINGDNATVAQNFLSALSFGVTKAQATASFKDDIAAIEALQAGIRKEIRETGNTADLQQQLFDAQQSLITARNNARNATQFKALGLTSTGDTVTPGVKKLKSELSALTGVISGTFLDTSKTQSVLSQLSKVLSGGLGVVGQQVRAKVQSIIDGLNNQLKNNAGNLSKFQHVASASLLAGLGLSPDQIKALRSRITQLGPDGTAPAHGPAFALAGAGGSGSSQGSGGVTINGGLHLHGIQNPKQMEAALIKLKSRRAPRRTGPN